MSLPQREAHTHTQTERETSWSHAGYLQRVQWSIYSAAASGGRTDTYIATSLHRNFLTHYDDGFIVLTSNSISGYTLCYDDDIETSLHITTTPRGYNVTSSYYTSRRHTPITTPLHWMSWHDTITSHIHTISVSRRHLHSMTTTQFSLFDAKSMQKFKCSIQRRKITNNFKPWNQIPFENVCHSVVVVGINQSSIININQSFSLQRRFGVANTTNSHASTDKSRTFFVARISSTCLAELG